MFLQTLLDTINENKNTVYACMSMPCNIILVTLYTVYNWRTEIV